MAQFVASQYFHFRLRQVPVWTIQPLLPLSMVDRCLAKVEY